MEKFQNALMEEFGNDILKLDDTFQFDCRKCWNCCKERRDIVLTALDLFNIAKELNLTPRKVVTMFCDCYTSNILHMPIVCITPQGIQNHCPFLADDHCLVREARPEVCRLFPLARINVVMPFENVHKPIDTMFMLYPTSCNDAGKTHTVRNWLKTNLVLDNSEFYNKWIESTRFLFVNMCKLEKFENSNELVPLLTTLIQSILYFNYSTASAFLPQFEENTRKLKVMMNAIVSGMVE